MQPMEGVRVVELAAPWEVDWDDLSSVLLTEVWGPSHGNDSGYLRLYMAQLRRKLEPDPAHPRYLVTESGMGYRFAPGGQ